MRKEKTEHSARLPFAASMLIFGTIGLLRRFIDLPSGVIACFRGLLGCVLLLLLQRLGRKKPGLAAIRKSLLPLLISGGMIGFNWMLLFEAYRYTSIAVATLCYYTAPVMLILASPFVFHERLTWRQLVCVGLAACGMVLVSGVLDGGTLPDGTLTGIALAVGSAVYTCGELTLDTASHAVRAAGRPVQLTRTEYAILKLLMQNPGQVLAKSVLLDRISADTPDCTESSLKTHVSNLRGKLRAVSGRDYVEAVWGIGFRLAAES